MNQPKNTPLTQSIPSVYASLFDLRIKMGWSRSGRVLKGTVARLCLRIFGSIPLRFIQYFKYKLVCSPFSIDLPYLLYDVLEGQQTIATTTNVAVPSPFSSSPEAADVSERQRKDERHDEREELRKRKEGGEKDRRDGEKEIGGEKEREGEVGFDRERERESEKEGAEEEGSDVEIVGSNELETGGKRDNKGGKEKELEREGEGETVREGGVESEKERKGETEFEGERETEREGDKNRKAPEREREGGREREAEREVESTGGMDGERRHPGSVAEEGNKEREREEENDRRDTAVRQRRKEGLGERKKEMEGGGEGEGVQGEVEDKRSKKGKDEENKRETDKEKEIQNENEFERETGNEKGVEGEIAKETRRAYVDSGGRKEVQDPPPTSHYLFSLLNHASILANTKPLPPDINMDIHLTMEREGKTEEGKMGAEKRKIQEKARESRRRKRKRRFSPTNLYSLMWGEKATETLDGKATERERESEEKERESMRDMIRNRFFPSSLSSNSRSNATLSSISQSSTNDHYYPMTGTFSGEKRHINSNIRYSAKVHSEISSVSPYSHPTSTTSMVVGITEEIVRLIQRSFKNLKAVEGKECERWRGEGQREVQRQRGRANAKDATKKESMLSREEQEEQRKIGKGGDTSNGEWWKRGKGHGEKRSERVMTVLSDIDDTLFAIFKDRRLPMKTVYPGSGAFYDALLGRERAFITTHEHTMSEIEKERTKIEKSGTHGRVEQRESERQGQREDLINGVEDFRHLLYPCKIGPVFLTARPPIIRKSTE